MMNERPSNPPLEMWGGVESTVNRVGDRYFDQLERNGHASRIDDLDRFAELGIRAIRYPVLWERTAPDGIARMDWTWPDARLDRLRELGLRPIVGLLHHGSGPRDTSLLDPAFPERLAAYAGAVARRYPWLEDYTPVNEPLTTARFSALYGYWYPHHHDDLSFARALLNQCRAVVLAMRAIRTVNPAARLVQTDDLGKTHGTPALAYQAEWENERRWLTFDLLTGSLAPDRPMWGWLRWVGVPEAELAWFRENPCPPDVIGINHYLSSERFLDERVDRYPTETPGTNGRHTYVDILATRVLPDGAAGPQALLGEAWERYRVPLAITEAHNGCTREEQLRWLDDVWRAAEGARRAGADVRAVTVWALLGAYDWHCMVTRDDGHYEPGVFDLRAPTPRPTAIARMVRDLATDGRHTHPVLDVPGWWRRPDRLIYGRTATDDELVAVARPESWPDAAPLLLIGSGGRLTRALGRACDARHIPYRIADRRRVDLTDPSVMAATLAEQRPWATIDLAASDDRNGDRLDAPACSVRTAASMGVVAAAAASSGLPLVTFSRDRVFDGRAGRPYTESDPMTPGDPAGARQARAETSVTERHPGALVVRTGPLLGGEGEPDIVASVLRALEMGVPIVLPGDERMSPTGAPDAAHAALDLLIDGERGIWHLTHQGAASWADVGRMVAAAAGLGDTTLIHEPATATGRARGRCRVLESTRGWLLPTLDRALAHRVAELLADRRWRGAAVIAGASTELPEDLHDHGWMGVEAAGD